MLCILWIDLAIGRLPRPLVDSINSRQTRLGRVTTDSGIQLTV